MHHTYRNSRSTHSLSPSVDKDHITLLPMFHRRFSVDSSALCHDSHAIRNTISVVALRTNIYTIIDQVIRPGGPGRKAISST